MSRRYFKCIIVVAIGLVTVPSRVGAQQGPPIVSASFDFLPYSNIDNPRAGTFEEALEIRVANPRFAINISVRLSNGRTTIVNGVAFSALTFSYRGPVIPGNVNRPDELYGLSYRLTVRSRIGDSWAVTLLAQPGIASNFENVSGDHLRFQGGVVFTKIINLQTQLGFGAMVQNQFGQILPLPVLNINWRGTTARVDAQLPKQAAVLLTPGELVEIGVAAHVEGNKYRLGLESAPIDDPVIKYSNITAGPALNIRLTPRALLRVTGGVSLARRFEVTDQNDVELRKIDLKPGGFVRAGVELRPAPVR